MSDRPTLVYLESDDEVTSVVRRIRAADAERVVLVAPGRSRATSSVVALRLLAGVGEDEGRQVLVVGDALTRSLAADAGLDAYRTVDDARAAEQATVKPGPRGAVIHVVRGDVADETRTAVVAGDDGKGELDTQQHVLPPSRPAAQTRSQTAGGASRRGLPLALLLAAVVGLLTAAAVLGAVVVPAASIRVSPRLDTVGPVAYEVRVDDPQRVDGTVSAEATVTATGTYPVQARATGAVVLYNWTFVPVEVLAGTFVAAGEQAFATQATVIVPRGSLTADGRIRAGQVSVAVTAAAVGPAANVAARAIDVVLDATIDQRLRGFPENPERRVENPEATGGGVDSTGAEITQEDVDAARASLLAALDVAATEALGASADAVFADPSETAEPVIDGLDGLAGTRDQETAEISGRLAYDRLVVEPDVVTAAARERLMADPTAVRAGHRLVPDAIEVVIRQASRDGDSLVVEVTVTGASMAAVEESEVMARARGRSVDEARAALRDLGDATIQLWPGWVTSVPGLEWRVEVEVAVEPSPKPSQVP